MKELKQILKAFDEAQNNGIQTALATVVHVEGSSYRRAGARMLVTEDGELTGAISGGCLEGDALRKAQLVMFKQKSMLVTYDTTGEDDAKFGVGLGCNGIIHILIEPIDPESRDNPIQLFKEFFGKRQDAVVVTLFSMKNKSSEQPGTCLFLNSEGGVRGTLSDQSLKRTLIADAKEVLSNHNPVTKVYRAEDELTGFVELLKPSISLIIVGAGNDAIPLTHMAPILGWETTLVDGRANYATRERFPMANKIIVAKPDEALPQLSPDARTGVILMTHNYNYDLAMLRQLILLQIPYIGTLGPKKRTDQMLDDLQEAGVALSDDQLHHIYGPVGLDIGAETSEEIALSVFAEIGAVFSGKPGSHLREKEEPIHDRESTAIA
ncbi:MAG TPA: XdhC/CoxI family protein [Balneolales bacterium]|nr:XdhC/CoxI family protein [Balneolales bacterium]